MRRLRISGLVVILVGSIAGLRGADTAATDWASYNRTLTSERYAPLDQINKSNVSRLKQVCVYDLNVDVNFQAGPIVVGRTMYVTADREILAIDAATCQEKWRVREESPAPGQRVNRGAAYLDGRLYRGTGDGDVVSYDAATGKKVWTTHLADPDKGESTPAAPIAWNGMIFIGTAGSERYGVKGRVYALDAGTGKRIWETYTVPTDAPQPGNETMQKQARGTWGNAEGVQLPAAVPGPPTRSIRIADCSTSLSAIPVRTSQRTCGKAPTSTRIPSLCSTRRLASIEATTRSSPPISTTGTSEPLQYSPPRRQVSAWLLERRKTACSRLRSRKEHQALRDADHDTAERHCAALDDAHTLLPRCGWRELVEWTCVQPRHESVLRRDRRLVRHGHAGSVATCQEAGSDVDRD
jgi:hypothetical protein